MSGIRRIIDAAARKRRNVHASKRRRKLQTQTYPVVYPGPLFRQLLSQAATKNTRVKNTIRAKLQEWKMSEWKMREQIAGVKMQEYTVSHMDRQPKNKLRQR